MELQQERTSVRRCVECLQGTETGSNIPVLQKLKSQIDSFSDDKDLLNNLCEDISSVQAQRSTFRRLFDELRNSSNIVDELGVHQSECNEGLDYSISRQKALFEKCFGLRFKLTEDKAISFEFRHLIPAHLDECCSITLDVNSEGQWEVVQMEPCLSGVQALLNLLNQTSSLREFCKLLRLKFKEHITMTMGHTS